MCRTLFLRLFGKLLPAEFPIGLAQPSALLNPNGGVLPMHSACNKSDFRPCTPVATTLLTDWGWYSPNSFGVDRLNQALLLRDGPSAGEVNQVALADYKISSFI